MRDPGSRADPVSPVTADSADHAVREMGSDTGKAISQTRKTKRFPGKRSPWDYLMFVKGIEEGAGLLCSRCTRRLTSSRSVARCGPMSGTARAGWNMEERTCGSWVYGNHTLPTSGRRRTILQQHLSGRTLDHSGWPQLQEKGSAAGQFCDRAALMCWI